jgi:hypothetical protein
MLFLRTGLPFALVVLVLQIPLLTGDGVPQVSKGLPAYERQITSSAKSNPISKPLYNRAKIQDQTQAQGQSQNDHELPVPQECAGADFEKLGRPLMFDFGIGVSVGTKSVVYGNRVPFYIWIVNQGDEPRFTSSCNIEWFVREAFDIFDAKGNRVRSVDEHTNPQLEDAWKTNPQNHRPPTCPFDYECTANMKVRIAPHSCAKSERGNLADSYVLKPGDYFISAREILDCSNLARRSKMRKAVKTPSGRLQISILAR